MSMIRRVLENLTHKPATRNFPAECRIAFDDTRGAVHFDGESCKYCGACAMVCPAAAIEVDRKGKELTFEQFRCVSCGACLDACKVGSVTMDAEFRCPAYEKPTDHLVGPQRKVANPTEEA